MRVVKVHCEEGQAIGVANDSGRVNTHDPELILARCHVTALRRNRRLVSRLESLVTCLTTTPKGVIDVRARLGYALTQV